MRIVSNVNKLASGGSASLVSYVPFIPAAPTVPNYVADLAQLSAGAAKSSSTAPTSKQNYNDKGIGMLSPEDIRELKNNMLDSDRAIILHELAALEKMLSGYVGSEATSQYTVSRYQWLLNKMGQAINEYKQFKENRTHAIQQGTLNEAAIDSNGFVFVTDGKGGIAKKLLGEFNPKELRILTVDEISRYRNSVAALAFKDDLTSVIGNSPSEAQVSLKIREIVSAIKSNSVTTDKYIRKLSTVLQQLAAQGVDISTLSDGVLAMALLNEEGGPAGVYKLTTEATDSKALKAYALDVIIGRLSSAEKTLLGVRALLNGLSLKTGPTLLILSYIEAGTGSTIKSTLSFDSSATNEALGRNKASGSGDGDKAMDFDWAQALLSRDIPLQVVLYGKPLQGLGLLTKAMVLSGLPKAEGRGFIGAGSLALIADSGLTPFLDLNSAHIGGLRIDSMDFNRLYYKGGGVKIVDLPYIEDGNGTKVPYWSIMDKYNEAKNELEKQGKTVQDNPREFLEMLEREGIGNLLLLIMSFAVLDVMGDDELIDVKDPMFKDFFVRDKDDSHLELVSTGLGTKLDGKIIPMEMGDLYSTSIYIPIDYGGAFGDVWAGMATGNYPTQPKSNYVDRANRRSARYRYNSNLTVNDLQ